MSATDSPQKSTLAKALLYVAGAGLALHAAHQFLGLGGSGLDWLLDRSLYYGLAVCAAGASVVMFRENKRLLEASRAEARTDELTGLGNRRRLIEDLARAFGRPEQPHVFALFDLDGFKAYNDSFGHTAGDTLLRTARREASRGAVAPDGFAYRLGGDEFCILMPVGGRGAASRSPRPRAALAEQGTDSPMRSSCGAVLSRGGGRRPRRCSLADRRMYAQKSRRPRSAERQTRDVLLRALQERAPDARRAPPASRASLAAALAAAHLGREELDEIARAAELHDIGKIAIPDGILQQARPARRGRVER